MYLGTLRRVAECIGQPAIEDVARSLESALRYFREAAPKHTADEEDSLFPRLRKIHSSEVTSALTQLDELEEEHGWANTLHSEVDRLGTKFLSEGTLSTYEIASFGSAIGDLCSMYERHIQLEDKIIFPLASRFLNRTDKLAIGSEMEARRKK